jgi:hypothetical protein
VKSVYQQFRLLEQTEEKCIAPRADLREVCRPWTAPMNGYVPCDCGKCKSCVENAQWDRIFNEKFADPNYYGARTISHGSSLGWLK